MQHALKSNVAGLKLAVDMAAEGEKKFFSILNRDDPINKLTSYGWRMHSDNYFRQLGYYLIIQHDDVLAGRKIIVGRALETDKLKKDNPEKWQKTVAQIYDSTGPLLALDYSYLSLLADESAPAGGVIYMPDKKAVEFYFPLSQWSNRLSALFKKQTPAP